MKTTKVVYACDLCKALPNEASTSCALCKRDTCEKHRAWMDTRFQHGPGVPGKEPPFTGFNLCTECRDNLEASFDALRRPGDGVGQTNKKLLTPPK